MLPSLAPSKVTPDNTGPDNSSPPSLLLSTDHSVMPITSQPDMPSLFPTLVTSELSRGLPSTGHAVSRLPYQVN